MHSSVRNLFIGALFGVAVYGCQDSESPVDPTLISGTQNQVLNKEVLDGEAQALGKIPTFVREITAPTVITEPGVYRLSNDFTVMDPSGDGIIVRASHVLLDLRGRTITGPGHKAGRGIVIEGAENVLVRDGKLARFGLGVVLLDVSKSVVKNVKIQGGDETANPPAGNPPQIGVMLVNSRENVIARNWMGRVNLGIFVRGGGSSYNQIVDNDVTGGQNGLLGICYNPAPGGDPATDGPSNDKVNRNFLNRFGTGIQTSAGSAMNSFGHNTIKYFVSAYSDLNGTNEFKKNSAMQIMP